MTNYNLYLGDCLDVMDTLEENTFHSIVTDPPYGLSFMGKNWDHGVPGVPFWEAALRVTRPGGHLVAFGGTRTHHRLMVAIEDAGWEIRDCLMWVYSSGFPKSLNVSKDIDRIQGVEREVIERTGQRCGMFAHSGSGTPQDINDYEKVITAATSDLAKEWDGWGTGLKPAWEPIILARKPISEKNIALNVLKWGTGAINIGASRIPGDSWKRSAGGETTPYSSSTTWNTSNTPRIERGAEGRWPANFMIDDSEEVAEQFPDTKGRKYSKQTRKRKGFMLRGSEDNVQEADAPDNYGDSGSAARFFYCSKAQKRDRNEGLEDLEFKISNDGRAEHLASGNVPMNRSNVPKQNFHPTVKPTDLMRYLCTLITVPNGLILDPFMGSGSTGKAAVLDGYNFVGIDTEQEYLDIARLRIEYALSHKDK